MKKCLSLLLAALMLAAVLTGCGGNPSTEETDTPADTGTEQAAQTNWNVSSVTGTGTELKFRTGGDQGTYYGFGSVLAQAITTNGQRNQGHGRGQQRLPGQHRADADERGPTGLRPVRRDELRL